MNLRSLLNVGIKLIGLYILVNTLIGYSPTIFFQAFTLADRPEDTGMFLLSLTVALVWGGLIPLLLMTRTASTIRIFRLDSGLDETEGVNRPGDEKLLKIGFIVVGGLTVVDVLPEITAQAYNAIKYGSYAQYAPFDSKQPWQGIMKSSIGLLLGIIILTNYDRIARWILPKIKDN